MDDYVLSCCSTADLSLSRYRERGISVVFFHFELDGKDYLDDCGQSLSSEELFRQMDAGAMTKTSQVSTGEYMDFWRPFLKEGKDILHICFSSGLSGSYQSALVARDELKEEFPERKILLVDSMAASSGYGLLMDTLADLKKGGMGMEELCEWAEANKLRLQHWFFSTDLTYYIRGGRVSKGAGMIGQALNICPLLNVNYKGELAPREKIRGKKKVMQRTLEMMKQHAENGLKYSGKCFISHSLFQEEAKELASMIEQTFPELNGKVEIFPIGATIGSHTGPGTIALFFWGDQRTN